MSEQRGIAERVVTIIDGAETLVFASAPDLLRLLAVASWRYFVPRGAEILHVPTANNDCGLLDALVGVLRALFDGGAGSETS